MKICQFVNCLVCPGHLCSDWLLLLQLFTDNSMLVFMWNVAIRIHNEASPGTSFGLSPKRSHVFDHQMALTLQIPIENSGFIEYAARLHWAKIWLEDIPLRKQMLASWLPWSCTSDHSQTRTIKLLLGLPATFPQYQEQNIHLWQWGTQLLSNHQPSSYCRGWLLHSLCLYNKRAFMTMGYTITTIIMIRTKYWTPGTVHIIDIVVFRRVYLLLLPITLTQE